VSSMSASVTTGVPQGSVLGPLLFTSYKAPVYQIACRHGVCSHFYADDTQFSVEFPSDGQSAAYCRLCGCLNETRDWMTRNRLKLNDDKADLLIVYSARARRKPSLNLKLPNESCCLTLSDSVWNLGVTLDSQLTMERRVRGVWKTASFHLRSIGLIRRLLNRTATKALVHAFVLSRLDYCNALFAGLPEELINRLQRMQNAPTQSTNPPENQQIPCNPWKFIFY
jgi:hypothetical protein